MNVGLRSYAVAVAAVAGATVVVAAMRPLPPGLDTPVFLAAVAVASWYGGRWPGLVATALSLLASEAVLDAPSPARALILTAVAVLIVGLQSHARAARESAEALARAREELVRQEQAARADAETAGRSKDEFLAVLSHELRTPLNALMGWIWWLRRGALDADRQERAMETIERSTTSLAQLVEDLLDLSRIITGRLRLSLRTVEPAPVIAAGVAIAFLVGLVPAQIVAQSRAASAYDDIRARLRADYDAADTPQRWATLAVARADALDLARTRMHRLAISSCLIWLAVAGATSFVWFRMIDWPENQAST